MVKSAAQLAWLQGLEATGTTAAGLCPGTGMGSRAVPSQPQLSSVPALGWVCRDQAAAVPARAPCRARANNQLLHPVHIPAGLSKAGAGMCQEGSAILGNIQGQEGHGQRPGAECAGCGGAEGGGAGCGGAEGWLGVLGAGVLRVAGGAGRMMESGCSQRSSSRSL